MENVKDQTKEDIINLINSNGWQIVKKLFNEEKLRLQNIDNIDESQSPELQAIAIKGNKEAVKIITNILFSVEAQAKMEAKKKVKYI